MKDCYSVTTYSVQSILGLIESGDIAIPEIQRPFVWDSTKVRDLIDSLYYGYPTGYLITWKNPDVKIKGGGVAEGKTVLIDGQQRGLRSPPRSRVKPCLTKITSRSA